MRVLMNQRVNLHSVDWFSSQAYGSHGVMMQPESHSVSANPILSSLDCPSALANSPASGWRDLTCRLQSRAARRKTWLAAQF